MNNIARAGCFVAAATLLSTAAGAQEPIRIGAIGPFSGPAAGSGIAMQRAWEFVVERVNADGGLTVDGEQRPVEMLFEDSQSRPEVGISAAQKLLTRDDVDILVGELFHSSVTLAIMELAPSFPNKVFYTGQPVSQEIAKKIASDLDSYANYWKFSFNSDSYAKTSFGAINDLIEVDDKTIAFVAEDTDYGKSNVEYAQELFEADGWQTVAVEYVPIGHTDFYPQLSKLKADAPAVLHSTFTSPASGAALVRQMQEQELDSLNFAIFYPTTVEFKEAAGETADGLLYSPLLFDPANNDKHAALADEMGDFLGIETSGDHAFGYCNAALMMDAIERAGSVEAAALNEAMAATDFECTLGRWVFDPANHSPLIGPEYFAVPAAQIQNGADFVVWPETVATADYKPQS